MKKITHIILLTFWGTFCLCQNSEPSICDNEGTINYSFNYQGFINYEDGAPILIGQSDITISISKNEPQGDFIFEEKHSVNITKIGFFSVDIGSQNPRGMEDFIFDIVDNGYADFYIDVSIKDLNNNSKYIGSKKIPVVPYAIAAYGLDSFGARGRNGEPGAQGLEGPQGPQGPNGANGIDGRTGATGNNGNDGFGRMTLRSTPPNSTNLYVDDGTNTADGKPHLRHKINGTWFDL